MERLKVGFAEPLRRQLDEAVKKHGTSLADEVRARVWQTFQNDSVPEQNKRLLNAISNLMDYTERQTGWPWHADPFAFDVLRHAIARLLEREQPPEKPAGDPPRKPERLVASKDPKEIGVGLETLAFNSPPSDTQFRPDVSIGVVDAAPVRRALKLQREDEKANRKRRKKGQS